MKTKAGITKDVVLNTLVHASPNDFTVVSEKANHLSLFYHYKKEDCLKIIYHNHKYVFQIPFMETRRGTNPTSFKTCFSIQWFKSKRHPKTRRK